MKVCEEHIESPGPLVDKFQFHWHFYANKLITYFDICISAKASKLSKYLPNYACKGKWIFSLRGG